MFTGGHDRDDNADECYTATTLTSVQRARQWHYIGQAFARWHEGGLGELRQDPAAVARRVMIELPTMFVRR